VTVPFLDLTRLHRSIAGELEAAFHQVVESSRLVGPKASAAFEANFATAHGRLGAVGCASGTDALMLALVALGIGQGDEVVVPAMTFVATAEAVIHAGATPVVADVDPVTLLLSSAGVEAVRTDRTRAVVPVHLYGHVVPFDLLAEWRSSELLVLEDAAQAHLASYAGQPVGEVGHAACFSFYPGKNLGALGDGGAIATDDTQLLARAALLRDHGRAERYCHDVVGWCSRLDGIQAAWLDVKLRHLPSWTQRRRELAEMYRRLLPDGLLVPWQEGAVHHLVVIRVPKARRNSLVAGLAAAGIETGLHYPRALSQQLALAALSGPCPDAERAAAEVLSLPIDPLMSDDDVREVASSVVELLGHRA
jgi:dTDP-4-amino-4,6-dideoxygalactose transaminase